MYVLAVAPFILNLPPEKKNLWENKYSLEFDGLDDGGDRFYICKMDILLLVQLLRENVKKRTVSLPVFDPSSALVILTVTYCFAPWAYIAPTILNRK